MSSFAVARRMILGEENIPPENESEGESEGESFAALAILTLMVLLGLALTLGHFLERKRISWMTEAGGAMLLGVAMGWFVKIVGKDNTFQEWLSFKDFFFYFALLPPIIFEAGFSLNVKPFARNIGAICALAFLGTLLSTFLVGFTMWAASALGLCYKIKFLEALLFGSMISATDPVSVLAIFQRLNADEDLYTLVFGESIFNDAVAIVLFRTLKTFLTEVVTPKLIVVGALKFVEIFVSSMLIGVGFGLISSLVFKSKMLTSEHSSVEAMLVILFAFSSFFTAEGLALSGIVAILFCGMIMARYTRPNLSRRAERSSISFFKILASLSETFVFIYIGTTLFLQNTTLNSGMTWAFLVIAIFALAHSRFFVVYLNCKLVNSLRPDEMHIPKSHQFMLWFSGLRGAIAFALAITASTESFTGNRSEVGEVLLTCTFFIILATVLVNGGATTWFLEKFQLRSTTPNYRRLIERVGTEASIASDIDSRPDVVSPSGSAQGGILGKIREMNRVGLSSKLQDIDDKYLSRFFIPDGMELVKRNEGDAAENDAVENASETNTPRTGETAETSERNINASENITTHTTTDSSI